MALRVCFLVGSLGPSGGVRAIVQHATALARDHGMEVSLALEADSDADVAGVRLVTVEQASTEAFDVAIATWWRTAYRLPRVPARRHAYFVQQLEDRVYRSGDVERFGAALTHDLPVSFLSEAAWVVELLGELRPGAPAFHVPNGVDKQRFAAGAPRTVAGPLRVLVEGSPNLWFKGVDEAIAVLDRTGTPLDRTLVTPEPPSAPVGRAFDRVVGPLDPDQMAELYAQTDVLLKLSRVEGVFTPPLEAFHLGATCVVWPVTGHDEYVRHGQNGVVCDFDDLAGTGHWLELLSRDRALLERLRGGALETASAWPSWDEASTRFASAVRRIAESEQPGNDGGAQLLADVEVAMTDQRIAQQRLLREVQTLERRAQAAEATLAHLESTLPVRARALAGRLLASLRR